MIYPHHSTVVFMGTYPPRECGIATFTQDLLIHYQKQIGVSGMCKVAALNVSGLESHHYPPEVFWQINTENTTDYRSFAQYVNNAAAISHIVIQHEYGIYGGRDGSRLLSFMQNCHKPMTVTFHTVLPHPQEHMKTITNKIIRYAATIVVLTKKSKKILTQLYPESEGKIVYIPHGIHAIPFAEQKYFKRKLKLAEKSILLTTFGLLGRGKGIEYAISALPPVIQKYPHVQYLILGGTHPMILRKEGERYRRELELLVTKLNLQKHVRFYDQFLSLSELKTLLRATDIYLATSVNPDQAVSGTFSYALGTGRAIVSTAFAQAKEIITPEIGRLVPVKNAPAITKALIDLLDDPVRLKKMHINAYQITRPMLWSNVAKQYVNLKNRIYLPPLTLSHLKKMTNTYGIIQFAKKDLPSIESGYTLDDNARALIVCEELAKLFPRHKKQLIVLANQYLRSIVRFFPPDKETLIYLDKHGQPQIRPDEENDVSRARGVWALAVSQNSTLLSANNTRQATELLKRCLSEHKQLKYPRAAAITLKGLCQLSRTYPYDSYQITNQITTYANFLVRQLKNNTIASWIWYQPFLTYNNGVLPEALFLAYEQTGNTLYKKAAKSTLDFLLKTTFTRSYYLPIGNRKWYRRNSTRSRYDQQPEDPCATILALAAAYRVTKNIKYKQYAKKCYQWYLGKNSKGLWIYNKNTGGCFDGLQQTGVNKNQGAESLIAYLMAYAAIYNLQ